MNKKRFSRTDFIFIGTLLAVGILTFLIMQLAKMGQTGASVVITVDGETYGTYSLTEEQTIDIKIDGVVTNTLQVKDGKANMIDANCPDKLCVHQKEISKNGETIVCLPNKIVVEVIGAKEDTKIDSMAG